MILETKYLNIISNKLIRFRKIGDSQWNFRCPYCGDSQRSKSKARGYVYKAKNTLVYKCHNCSTSTHVVNLIKHVDNNAYVDYCKESFGKPKSRVKRSNIDIHTSKPKFDPIKLKTISNLQLDHPARILINKRNIPLEYYSKIYFAPRFFEFASQYDNKYNHDNNDYPRLIIPFVDENGVLFGFQGRAFGDESPKYLTVMLDKSKHKLYGMDKVKLDREVFVVEGPIDSMFLPNSIATCQSDLRIPKYKNITTLVPDNEPRNKEIVAKIEQSIDDGYKVVIWGSDIKEKDINDMVSSGHTITSIQEHIRKNTYYGLEAKIRLSDWKQI